MRTKTMLIILAAVIGGLALTGVGCLQKQRVEQNTVKETTQQGTEVSLAVLDQELNNDNVTVAMASIPENGWLVIHRVDNEQAGAIIGNVALTKGAHNDVVVAIDKTRATASLIAMLHYDKGTKGTFEPTADGPVIVNQSVIMKQFMLKNFTPPTTSPTGANTNPAPTTSAPTEGVKSFTITAKNWSFTPSTITVKKGDKVKITLIGAEGVHGFNLPAFGINKTIETGSTVTVEFTADKAGMFPFQCSVYCGEGHFTMKGSLVVQ